MTGDELMSNWPLLVSHIQARVRGIDPQDAEQIAGDCIEKALTRFVPRTDSPNGLTHWLLTVASNAATDWLRRRALRAFVPLAVADVARARIDAGSHQHDTILDVQAALGRMDPHQREIVWRHTVLDQTQVAAVFGPSRVKVGRRDDPADRTAASRHYRAAAARFLEMAS